MNKVINDIAAKLDSRKLFIIDAMGAGLSSFLLGLVLMNNTDIFGIPKETLFVLALIPIIFIIYDVLAVLSMFYRNYISFKIIAMLNIIYCVISFILCIIDYRSITVIGWLYIIGEILIVIGIALIELRKSKIIRIQN
jgi:hypothetical protein